MSPAEMSLSRAAYSHADCRAHSSSTRALYQPPSRPSVGPTTVLLRSRAVSRASSEPCMLPPAGLTAGLVPARCHSLCHPPCHPPCHPHTDEPRGRAAQTSCTDRPLGRAAWASRVNESYERAPRITWTTPRGRTEHTALAALSVPCKRSVSRRPRGLHAEDATTSLHCNFRCVAPSFVLYRRCAQSRTLLHQRDDAQNPTTNYNAVVRAHADAKQRILAPSLSR